MQKNNKHLMGAFGLLGVSALTIAAIMQPNPPVWAVDSSQTVNVEVLPSTTPPTPPPPTPPAITPSIPAPAPLANIIFPKDGSYTGRPAFFIRNRYLGAPLARHRLIFKPGTPEQKVINIAPENIDDIYNISQKEVTINLPEYGPYTFVTEIGEPDVMTGFSLKAEDSISFTYSPVIPADQNNQNGDGKPQDNISSPGNNVAHPGNSEPYENPSITITVGDGVDAVSIQLFDKNNKPLLNPPFIYKIPEGKGKTHTITIPLDSYNIPAGDYRIEVTPLSRADQNQPAKPLVDTPTIFILKGYTPPKALNVPNTGFITIAGHSIVRSDFIATIFATISSATLFALFLTRKKSKKARN